MSCSACSRCLGLRHVLLELLELLGRLRRVHCLPVERRSSHRLELLAQDVDDRILPLRAVLVFFLDREYLLTRHVDPELGNAFGTFGYRRFGTFGYRRERDEGLELDGAQAGRFGAHSVPGRVVLAVPTVCSHAVGCAESYCKRGDDVRILLVPFPRTCTGVPAPPGVFLLVNRNSATRRNTSPWPWPPNFRESKRRVRGLNNVSAGDLPATES